MMKLKDLITKRTVSVVLCLAMLLSCLPVTAVGTDTGKYYDRVVDDSTMDNWTKYFSIENPDTMNAGGVWTDKSVFTDASKFPSSVKMLDDDKNFLTALSLIAANKEIVGYSTVPTDTVLILDLSNSMSAQNVTQLVAAANAAIKELQNINKNNRIGVVLYSGSSTSRSYSSAVSRLLPIDRYTSTARNGDFITYSGGTVSVNRNNVTGTKPNAVFQSKEHSGATYIQAGLWEAYKMFDEVPDSEIVIGDNNWQSGEYRMPIVVLMSDGAPTLGASKFADVENQTYGNSRGADVGNGNDSGITAGQGFLVQLTASYIKNRIENKYKVNENIGAGRSLFYTLGFNISADNNPQTVTSGDVAYSVLNPDKSTITDSLWTTYNNPATRNMTVNVKSRDRYSNGYTNVSVTKNSYVTDKSYVDKYFSASNDGLEAAFGDIVDEIILQSRYYPTHLEGGNPDFAGYVEFTDTLGEHMEVKHINGILLGDTLFDGHMMASKLADTGADGLGTPESPTELGDEFIRAVKSRLGLKDTLDAQTVVAKAYADGQLRYNGANDWSNYIAWYAKADGSYAGFYDEDGTEPVPADAVYINRSYGFLGETSGSIKNSDMMYVSVQVHTNISTGEQTVIWRVPAALVPMVTYLVSLDGTSVDAATNVAVTVEDTNVTPIRLLYETGLRSDLNPFNITRITGSSTEKNDENHLAADGHTRQFWNNSFNITAADHENHLTAMAEFTPNKENERFYYTFDSAVYKKTGSNYVLVTEDEGLDENGEYYHRRYTFNSNSSKPVFTYEKMSPASVLAARERGWQSAFENLTHQTVGAWVVPMGTPTRELKMYDEEKADNKTNSAAMVFYPYLTEQNNIAYVDMNLGNNGLLKVTPATGIQVSKTIDVFETNTSDTFRFRLRASVSGEFDSWITDLDATPSGVATTARLVNGVYEFELKKDQTFWITGLPAGTEYVIEEISDNPDYKVLSVHVNGQSTGKYATGTVAQYLIDDVDFVNTAIGEGDLVITKQVVDENGNIVDVDNAITFTAEVTLADESGNPVSGTFTSSKGEVNVSSAGKFTVTLADGESFVVRGIPEETRYTVVETDIPDGFRLDTARSVLTGVVDAMSNDRALIVNSYIPASVNGTDINVEVTKAISGSRTQWLSGESYSFSLESLTLGRASGNVIGTQTVRDTDSTKKVSFNLSGEIYAVPGTYYYKITETVGEQGGITYDTAERLFTVVVADEGMDGDLDIVSVNNIQHTTISGNWLVSANFNNEYAPAGSATATINIVKQMNGNHPLGGYQFALFDEDPTANADANELLRSGLTDAEGKAKITLTYSADNVGNTYTYYLVEVNRGQTVNNILYASDVYQVQITVLDNLDGTISADTVISGLAPGTVNPTFINTYVPSASDYVVFSGRKEIDGDRALNANEFAFAIEAVTAGAPMPEQTTVKNAADGSFVFPVIEFNDAHKGNTYVYRITEVDTQIGGFTYDTTVYTVSVTVADNGDQTITATAVINDGTADVSDIVFTNVYDASDVAVSLNGTKLLTGKNLQGDDFAFEITRITPNTPMPFMDAQSNTVTNNENGVISFGTLSFDRKGVYVYEITEQDLAAEGYTYDRSVYKVTVTVTDNSQGTLSAQVALEKDGLPSSEIVFRNSFVPTPISFNLHTDFAGAGKKVLDGRPLEAGEFEFVLLNARDGKQIGDVATCDANGAFAFPAVTLNTAGFYHFKIQETVGQEKGVTYDPTTYHIRLNVVQDADGTLKVVDKQLYIGIVVKEEVGGVLTEVTKYENITDGGTIQFNNAYIADPVSVSLEAVKTLSGRDLVDGEFKFDLHKTGEDFVYNKDTVVQNDVILELSDNGIGNILFQPEVFDAVGSYYYVIVEDEQDGDGITTDRTEYKVEIVVSDDLEGSLVAKLKVNNAAVEGSTAEAVTFQNTYKAAATEIVIKGTKTLSGRELAEGEFSFELYDKDNNKLDTVTNGADGSFAFKAIPVEQAGEYVYTVREVKGDASGVTYDTAEYTVKVTVTDNLDGTFKLTYTYLKDNEMALGMSFANTYTAPIPPVIPDNPKTGDTARLILMTVLAIASGLGLGVTAIIATVSGQKKKFK